MKLPPLTPPKEGNNPFPLGRAGMGNFIYKF